MMIPQGQERAVEAFGAGDGEPCTELVDSARSTLRRVDPCRVLPAPGPGIAGVRVRFGLSWAPVGHSISLVSSASAGTALYDRAVACCDLSFGDGFGAKLEWLTRVLALTWLIDPAAHDAAGVPKTLFWVDHTFSHGPVPQAGKVDAGETRAG